MTRIGIEFVQLSQLAQHERRRLCLAFYKTIYEDAFPLSDEREDPTRWLERMDDGERGPYGVEIICALRAGVPIAGIVFEWYPLSKVSLLTYLAVHPDERGKGVARRLLDESLAVIRSRAPALILAECEIPERIAAISDRKRAMQRIRTLARLGFNRVAATYVQPALSVEQQPDPGLYLITVLPAGDHIAADALGRFLREFYGVLEQTESFELASMLEQIGETPVPVERLDLYDGLAATDAIVGTARGISLRFIFMQPAARTPEGDYRELPLGEYRRRFEGNEAFELLSRHLDSFNLDIVTPYATENSLPLALLCEPFSRDGDGDAALEVSIRFDSVVREAWEGREVSLIFSEKDQGFIVSARFLDSVVLFESGYIAYTCSFLFAGSINVPLLLSLVDCVAGSAGKIEHDYVTFSLAGGAYCSFEAMLAARLEALRSPRHRHSVFDALRELGAEDLASRIRLSPGEHTVSVDLEVIGARSHDRVLDYAKRASARNCPVDPFSKRLAGLVQNVLDFDEQDSEEVNDSLIGGLRIGRDVTFSHHNVGVRFSPESRAYDRMRPIIGGNPYWYLVQAVIAHNERLLADLHVDIERERGTRGLSGMLRDLLSVPSRTRNLRSAENQMVRKIGRKIRLSHYIPNLFRYDTEQKLYSLFTAARGITSQLEYFQTVESAVENITDETARFNREQADRLLSSVLIAIGVIQIGGVFAAMASIGDPGFATFVHGLGVFQPARFLEELFERSTKGSSAVWALAPALGLVAFGGLLLLWTAAGAISRGLRSSQARRRD